MVKFLILSRKTKASHTPLQALQQLSCFWLKSRLTNGWLLSLTPFPSDISAEMNCHRYVVTGTAWKEELPDLHFFSSSAQEHLCHHRNLQPHPRVFWWSFVFQEPFSWSWASGWGRPDISVEQDVSEPNAHRRCGDEAYAKVRVGVSHQACPFILNSFFPFSFLLML